MRVENELYAVDIDGIHGLVTQVTDKRLGLELVSEPRLAESFRLILPIPNHKTNCLMGACHPPVSAERVRNGAWIRWNGEFVNDNGTFDVNVSLWIEFVGEAVQLRLEVQNLTAYPMTEVWYPPLGGFLDFGVRGERGHAKVVVPCGSSQWTCDACADGAEMLPSDKLFQYPGDMSMPWVSVYDPAADRSLYIGSPNTDGGGQAFLLTRCGACAQGQRGRPQAGVSIGWASFSGVRPGDTFYGPPIVLQCHKGDWRTSAAIHRESQARLSATD